MQTETMEQRVANGAALLDRIEPGWVQHVTKPINMYSNENCAIGQVLGSFEDHRVQVARMTSTVNLEALDAEEWRVRDRELNKVLWEHGFYVLPGDGSPDPDDVYALSKTWDAEVAARRT